MYRLTALLLTLPAIFAMACFSGAAPAASTGVSAPAQQPDTPTPHVGLVPDPTVNIDATVEARIQATLAAWPTPTPIATQAPTPAAVPTATPSSTPTAAPTPAAAPLPTPQIAKKIEPTPAASPTKNISGESLKLDPTPENYPLILLSKSNLALARRLSEFAWVQDGVSSEESRVLSQFRYLASENAALAEQIVGMPFFTDSAESGDDNTLYALYDLSISYPGKLKLLLDQDWFADGLTQNEARYVTILYTHAVLETLEVFGADDYQLLLDKALGEKAVSRTISLPRAGDIELVTFNRPLSSRNADRILDHLEAAVAAIEEFMTIPFPDEEILLLFTDPGEDALGLYVGTHMIASAELGVKDLNQVLTHELAHYYWCCSDNANLPLWIGEGGPNFLATYVSDQFNVRSLDERRRDLTSNYGEVTYCKTRLGIGSIQKLLTKLAENGYAKHRESVYFSCNYALGEILALDLYQFMGDKSFREAWKEIYRLSEETDELLPEEAIYQVFLNGVEDHKVKGLKEIYQRWHGGFGPAGKNSSDDDDGGY